ncbi:MAG: hypothetical protein GQF41_3062 [Candidatus Rifleibacterium amylolyticum]|nr:MAG: hypothetical protein GQF41_3062 [Candidatus Rifleibacterium amylolyticum]
MKAKYSEEFMIVDDHPLVRDGLTDLLTTAGFKVAGQAENSQSALSHPKFASCSVFVIDLSLGDQSGLDLIRQLNQLGKPVVVYSMHETSNVIKKAFDAGALGYVTKSEPPEILLEALKAVIAGKKFESPRVIEALSNSSSTRELSDQQKQIFLLLGRGWTNIAIANEMNISVRTLESYFVRIMDKLNIQGVKRLRQEAILAFKKDIPDQRKGI